MSIIHPHDFITQYNEQRLFFTSAVQDALDPNIAGFINWLFNKKHISTIASCEGHPDDINVTPARRTRAYICFIADNTTETRVQHAYVRMLPYFVSRYEEVYGSVTNKPDVPLDILHKLPPKYRTGMASSAALDNFKLVYTLRKSNLPGLEGAVPVYYIEMGCLYDKRLNQLFWDTVKYGFDYHA